MDIACWVDYFNLLDLNFWGLLFYIISFWRLAITSLTLYQIYYFLCCLLLLVCILCMVDLVLLLLDYCKLFFLFKCTLWNEFWISQDLCNTIPYLSFHGSNFITPVYNVYILGQIFNVHNNLLYFLVVVILFFCYNKLLINISTTYCWLLSKKNSIPHVF